MKWPCAGASRSARYLVSGVGNYLNIFYNKSGIHGFFYMAYTLLHFFEKVIWSVVITVAFVMCVVLSLTSLKRYQFSSTVVTIERDHYYWNITLPSITVCPISERLNRSLYDDYSDNFDITDTERNELFMFLESLANSTFTNFQNIKTFPIVEKLDINPEEYMRLIYNLTQDWTRRTGGSIQEYKVKTKQDATHVEVGQVLTEFGICYSTNNYILNNISTSNIPGIHEHFDGFLEDDYYNGKVVINILKANQFDGTISYKHQGYNSGLIQIFLHSPYDIMDVARKSYVSDVVITFYCIGIEIVADQGFRDQTSIQQRGCRYKEESNLTHYPMYTKGLCMQECRLNMAFKLCGCIPHFYPNSINNPKPVCHYTTLKGCMADHGAALLKLHDHTSDQSCFCDQNCEELNVLVDSVVVLADNEELLGSIGGIVTYKTYPMIRYKRKIMFSIEDLLVSVGGTAGLMTGFCVLGALEILYFATLRLYWYTNGRKIQ